MKALALVTAIATLAVASAADARGGGGGRGGSHSVKGYTTRTGTYVAPHRATNPNNTKYDNWSTKGNTNPHTGKPGTKNPF